MPNPETACQIVAVLTDLTRSVLVYILTCPIGTPS